jgi:hypothetical protein
MGRKSCHAIKQHYTPEMHLRHFANMKDQVYVYRKDGRGWPSNVNDTACKRYFYEFDVAGFRSAFAVEDRFGDLETRAPEIASKLSKFQQLSEKEYSQWSMYVATST